MDTVTSTQQRLLSPTVRCAYARIRALPIRRAFWLLMVAAHAPALVSASRTLYSSGFSPEHFGGCLFLAASVLFFGFKVWDVAWLRFRFDRRCWVAAFIIVALLHTNAIVHDANYAVAPPYVAVLVTVWFAGRLPAIRRGVGSWFPRLPDRPTDRAPVAGSSNTIWLDAYRPHCWFLFLRAFGLRAPPV